MFHGLLLIFAGILFGVFLYHVSYYLGRATRLSFRTSFLVVITGLLILLLFTTLFLGTRIVDQANQFSQQFMQSFDWMQKQLRDRGMMDWFNGGQGPQVIAPEELISTARTTLVSVIWIAGSILLVSFLGFYFALQSELYHTGVVALVTPRWRSRAREVKRIISRKLWWWILGRLVGMTLIGTTSALGLWLLGVPLPITLGVIAGLLNFVPNLGPLIAAIPAVLFASQQGTETALYVVALYCFLQFIESYLITPLIDQQQVSLPPGLILGAQLLLGMFGGIPALILATPLTVVVFYLVKELYVEDVLGGPP